MRQVMLYVQWVMLGSTHGQPVLYRHRAVSDVFGSLSIASSQYALDSGSSRAVAHTLYERTRGEVAFFAFLISFAS